MASKKEKRRKAFLRAQAWFLRRKEKRESVANIIPDDVRQSVDERQRAAGPMYDEVTARRILEEEVLVLASRSQNGEAVVGFDPDDAALDNYYHVDNDHHFWGCMNRRFGITPMIYYVHKGDAKMCRYLASRGASTTKADDSGDNFDFPMSAAATKGSLEICKFLYENGAQNDIQKEDVDRWTPFLYAANDAEWPLTETRDREDVVRWFTLHGGLFRDYDSWYNGERGHKDIQLPYRINEAALGPCQRLVEWAEEVTQTHSALVTFLIGALPSQNPSILQELSGVPGVRKNIGDFVGLEVTKKNHLRTLQNVVDILPPYLHFMS